MKLFSIRFSYDGPDDEIRSFELAVAVQAPGIELFREKQMPGNICYRADSHDPTDFYKLGMIVAINLRAFEDHRRSVKTYGRASLH